MNTTTKVISVKENEYVAFQQQLKRALILQLHKETYLTDGQLTRLLNLKKN